MGGGGSDKGSKEKRIFILCHRFCCEFSFIIYGKMRVAYSMPLWGSPFYPNADINLNTAEADEEK